MSDTLQPICNFFCKISENRFYPSISSPSDNPFDGDNRKHLTANPPRSLSLRDCFSKIFFSSSCPNQVIIMLRRAIHRWERKLSQKDVNRMNIPFEWGIEYLSDHISNRPLQPANGTSRAARDLIFAFNERAISDSDNYFSAPAISDFS